jgi:hypothetical protein
MDVFRRIAADELDFDFRESIWEIMASGDGSNPTNGEGMWIDVHYGPRFSYNVPDHPAWYCYGAHVSTNTMWNLYNKNLPVKVTDLRVNTAMMPYTFRNLTASPTKRSDIGVTLTPGDGVSGFSSTRMVGKYLRQFEKSTYHSMNRSSCNLPMLRYSDVLLMIAEAGIQTRNLGGTYPAGITNIDTEIFECVKQVRDRAGVASTTPTTFPDIEFIKDERARELCYECIRRQDLIRWGVFVKNIYDTRKEMMDAVSGVAPEGKTSIEFINGNVTNRSILWPIPSSEMSLNPLMVQNPGW